MSHRWPRPYLKTPFDEHYGRVSPDGRWLVYISNESGSSQAYIQSFPEPGSKQQVTRTGALFATWSRGGREINLFRGDNAVASVPVEPDGDGLRLGSPEILYHIPPNSTGGWDVAPDEQRFLVDVPAVETTPGISVMVNGLAGN